MKPGMIRKLALAGLLACSAPALASPPLGLNSPSQPAPVAGQISVELTAATLADDCGGGGGGSAGKSEKADSARKEKRRCEQSSMQLSIRAESGAAGSVQVKKVELFDDTGALLGQLTARSPTIWSEGGAYVPWDQAVAAGRTLSVSYALSQPDWGAVDHRRNKTYLLKAVLSVGGGDRTVQRSVTVAAEAI